MIRTARRARSRAAATLLAAGLVVATASCSSGDGGGSAGLTSSPSATALPVGLGCPADAEGGTQVRFGDDDHLGGVVVGAGTTGVVLAHESETDACRWLPYAKKLAAKGYTALAFDFAGGGASDVVDGVPSPDDDVKAAAAYLRDHGATKIVLVGASMGAHASLDDVADVAPEAVVSLSSPLSFGGEDVDPSQLTVPLLLLAAKQDAGGEFADVARLVAARAPSKHTKVVLFDSADHGTDLLRSIYSSDVEKDIEAFLRKYAPASS